MGAPLAASVNMRPRYAGIGKLRWSDEAYFQAYLSLWARRIDTTAHTYAAYLEIRRRKCFVNPGHSVYVYYVGVCTHAFGGNRSTRRNPRRHRERQCKLQADWRQCLNSNQ